MKPSFDTLYQRYKKIYDRMYTFSLCREDEIEEVEDFINTYWKKGHALVKSRTLMNWQYYNAVTHTYNFVIARSKESSEIHAIEGFIPTTQFDPSIKNAMTWGAIWKAIPNVAPPGLGFVVKRYRETEFATKYGCEVGISPDARKYNNNYQNTVFSLGEWFILNPLIGQFKLLEPSNISISNKIVDNTSVQARVVEKKDWLEIAKSVSIPEYKSDVYYLNRYFNHPFYNYYAVLLEEKENHNKEVFFFRYAEHNGSRCIFIVDFLGCGEVLSKSGSLLIDMLKRNDAEYMLFPCYGIDHSYLTCAGFTNRDNVNITIPLYYEPFSMQNVDIICATPQPIINWFTFKGDSDQDRPNEIKG